MAPRSPDGPALSPAGIAEFQKTVGGLIELVDQLAKAAESEKMKVSRGGTERAPLRPPPQPFCVAPGVILLLVFLWKQKWGLQRLDLPEHYRDCLPALPVFVIKMMPPFLVAWLKRFQINLLVVKGVKKIISVYNSITERLF